MAQHVNEQKVARRRMSANARSHAIAGYVFIAPFILGFLCFTIIPMGYSLYLSFTKYSIGGSIKWIGLDNYVRMFTNDSKFYNSIKVTLKFVLLAVPLKVGFALFIALILHTKSRAANVYRSAFYLPSLVGGSVAISIMWRELFSDFGVINQMLISFGLDKVSWLGDPRFAPWTLIAMTVWQFGSSMIIFAAGLKQIPETYYEAAKIDGANGFHRLMRITLPMLSSVIFFNLVMQIISGFMTFTQAFIITTGGPLESTMFYALYVYNRAFKYGELGYGSALAWFLLIMIAAATGLMFKFSNKWVYYESKGG